MRKYMTKEVTSTIIKMAKMEVNEKGLPTAIEVPSVTILGDINKERAQKLVNKNHDELLTVYAVETKTEVYRMKVTKFMEIAELVTDDNADETDTDDEEDEESPTEETKKGKYITS
jgi:hypothetical protein